MSLNCFHEHLRDSDDLDKRLLNLWFVTAIVLKISHFHTGIPQIQNTYLMLLGNIGAKLMLLMRIQVCYGHKECFRIIPLYQYNQD